MRRLMRAGGYGGSRRGGDAVTCESAAWDRDIFGPFLGPRRYVSERFGVSASDGQRRGSAQGLNRNYRDVVLLRGTG